MAARFTTVEFRAFKGLADFNVSLDRIKVLVDRWPRLLELHLGPRPGAPDWTEPIIPT